MTNCQKCGARIDPEDEFCPDCGAKIIPKITAKEPKKEVESIIETVTQAEPTKKIGWWRALRIVIILIVIIFIFRACSSSFKTSAPQISPSTSPAEDYNQPYREPSPPAEQASSPSYSPPESKKIDKSEACSGVKAEISDACWSCGIVDCGMVVTVQNTGTKPIFRFKTITYTNEIEKDESDEWAPLDVGAKGKSYPYTSNTDKRMVELIPVVIAGPNKEEVICEGGTAKFGNAYGNGFKECLGSY